MEIIDQSNTQPNNQLLVLLHLSQLLNLITGMGGLIVPLIIWLTQKDKVTDMDEQGKEVLNFQISMLLFAILSIPGILFFGLGILALIVIGIISVVFPIIGAVKASNREFFKYPLKLDLIK